MSKTMDHTPGGNAAPVTGVYECTGIRCTETVFAQILSILPKHKHSEWQGPVRWRLKKAYTAKA
jgi:hypothetical protein